jgi:hypothetical protein
MNQIIGGHRLYSLPGGPCLAGLAWRALPGGVVVFRICSRLDSLKGPVNSPDAVAAAIPNPAHEPARKPPHTAAHKLAGKPVQKTVQGCDQKILALPAAPVLCSAPVTKSFAGL